MSSFNFIWQWLWQLVKGKPNFDRTFWLHGFVGFSLLLPILITQITGALMGVSKIFGAVIIVLSVTFIAIYVICVSIGIWRLGSKKMSPDIFWIWRWMARGYLIVLAYSVILKLLRLGF